MEDIDALFAGAGQPWRCERDGDALIATSERTRLRLPLDLHTHGPPRLGQWCFVLHEGLLTPAWHICGVPLVPWTSAFAFEPPERPRPSILYAQPAFALALVLPPTPDLFRVQQLARAEFRLDIWNPALLGPLEPSEHAQVPGGETWDRALMAGSGQPCACERRGDRLHVRLGDAPLELPLDTRDGPPQLGQWCLIRHALPDRFTPAWYICGVPLRRGAGLFAEARPGGRVQFVIDAAPRHKLMHSLPHSSALVALYRTACASFPPPPVLDGSEP